MKTSTMALWASFLGAALAVGCVALPPPTARVASAAAAIRAAQELRVDDDPAAQVRMQYAKDEYAHGQRAMDIGDHEKAERMFTRAEVDAELAVAIAKQVRSEKAAYAAQVDVQKVNAK